MQTNAFIGISEVKSRFPQVVKDLEEGETDEVYVLRNNNPVAVVVSPSKYEDEAALRQRIEHLEDALLVLEARMADSGEQHDLDDVLSELGINA